MSVQQTLESRISEQLSIEHLEVINESHHHAGHAHGGAETHYKVVVVSTDFEGKRKVARGSEWQWQESLAKESQVAI